MDNNALFDNPLAMAGLSVLGGKDLGTALTEAAQQKQLSDYKNAQMQLWQAQAAKALQEAQLGEKGVVTKDAAGNPMLVNPRTGQTTPIQGVGGGQPAVDNSGLSGDAFLQTLDPGMAREVKSIAQGNIPINGRSLSKLQPLLQAVTQYDPTFNASDYNSRAKTRADFTSGKSAQNITSLNTALGHINSLLDNADALNNTSVPWFNSAVNSVESGLGDTRVKNFNTTRDAVADELTRVFRGTGGAVSDVNSWKEKLDSAGSPEQFKGVAKQMADLLTSRMDALGQQYNQGMGTTKDGIDLLSPKAQKAYQRISGEPAPMGNAGGPPAAAVQYLKMNPQAAGAFEAKYGVSAKDFLGGK